MSRPETEALLGDLAAHGNRPALVTARGQVSFEQLARDSNRLANGLFELGVRRGERFAFLLPNGEQIVRCYLACARSGIVGVPLSARSSQDELVYQLQDAGVVALLHAPEWADRIAEIRDRAPGVASFICDQDAGEAIPYATVVEGASEQTPPAILSADDPFCVMYTGGTTGASKAAIQTQGMWACCLAETVEQLGLDAGDRHVAVVPMTHAAWFTVAAHLSVGAVSHLLERWDPVAYLELVERERLTTLHLIPTLLGDVLAAAEARAWDLGSVRLLTLAGAPIPIELYRRARALFGDVIANIYGLTEAAGPVTYLLPGDLDENRLHSGGRPGRYVEVEILADGSEEDGSAVGEIVLRGPQVTPGYLNRPDETAAAFRNGWFCTGDIGYVDREGFLYVLDRKKEMIKSGGLNVYPKEVEEVLYRHPAVLEAAVIGLPDPRWIEAVTAVVVLRPAASAESEDLIQHCRAHLAGYKVPKALHLAEALPRTSFGKFDKKALERRYTTS